MTWKNPFDPKTGEFTSNIRATAEDDLTELRESMKEFGWLEELPALMDERDVVLVGHRRLTIAKELGIRPVIKKLKIGDGDEADSHRLRLAIASNIGFKPMTKEDRKRIAEYLYGEREWTMQRIAEALNVSQQQISKDLSNLQPSSKLKPAKTESNPKGAGRPKGSKRGQSPVLGKAREIVRENAAANESISPRKLQEEHGISHVTFEAAIIAEAARKEGIEEAAALDKSLLSKTAQEKLELAIRAHKRKLEAEFEDRVRKEYQQRIEEYFMPDLNRKLSEYEEVIRARRGIMPLETFNLIRTCLHSDSRKSVSDKKLDQAFIAFNSYKLVLVSEKENPSDTVRFPNSFSEVLKAAKRKSKT